MLIIGERAWTTSSFSLIAVTEKATAWPSSNVALSLDMFSSGKKKEY